MKIKLTFACKAPGRGEIRVYVHGYGPATIGDFGKDGNGTWTARLYRRPDDSRALAGIIIRSWKWRLRGAVRRQGKWWT